jgi:YNFM family putative membrane transporter
VKNHAASLNLDWLGAFGFGCSVLFSLLKGLLIYNYVGFRLIAPPYFLSQTAVGAVFALYRVGTVRSAWVGHLAGRLRRCSGGRLS